MGEYGLRHPSVHVEIKRAALNTDQRTSLLFPTSPINPSTMEGWNKIQQASAASTLASRPPRSPRVSTTPCRPPASASVRLHRRKSRSCRRVRVLLCPVALCRAHRAALHFLPHIAICLTLHTSHAVGHVFVFTEYKDLETRVDALRTAHLSLLK